MITIINRQRVNIIKFLIRLGVIFSIPLFLLSCSTIKVSSSPAIAIPQNSAIGVGPFANHSDTPLANRQVESVLSALLHAKGFPNVQKYPRMQDCEKLLYCPSETISRAKALRWAKMQHMDYLFLGSANEWRYKVGLDGEPVAGVSMQLINVRTGQTKWSAVGSAIGGSRDGLDVIGQTMLGRLIGAILCTGSKDVILKKASK